MPSDSSNPAGTATLRYALVTPARNEAAFIEATILSVVNQTVRPVKWVIVSDGSTDGTDAILQKYAAQYSWIEALRMPDRRDRQFAAKANCFNAGFAKLAGIAYDLVGNLDADITFEPDYFAFLISKFEANPKLGVAGTPYIEDREAMQTHTYSHEHANITHVSGACQIFRREAFAEVGGYVPVKGGAIDWIAVTTARMNGWQTRTFPEKVCFHHRKLGTGTHSPLRVKFHYGTKAYYVGGHPVWEFVRGIFQMREKPFVIGGVYFIAGYTWGFLRRMPRVVSPQLMAFHRSEQMTRLRGVFRRRAPRNDAAKVAHAS